MNKEETLESLKIDIIDSINESFDSAIENDDLSLKEALTVLHLELHVAITDHFVKITREVKKNPR